MRDYFTPPGAKVRHQVLIRHGVADDTVQWIHIEGETCQQQRSGTFQQLADDCQGLDARAAFILLVTADQVMLRTVELSGAELKHYRKLLPFELEDDFAEPADDLHFAFTAPNDGSLGLAVVRRSWLAGQLARFAEYDLTLTAVVPEVLLLPWQAEAQCWMVQDKYLVGRIGYCDGFRVPVNQLPDVVAMLVPQLEVPVQLTLVYEGEPQSQPDGIVEHLPTVDPAWQAEASLLGWLAGHLVDKPLNLLQGEYNASLHWRQHWRTWKPMALVAGLALVLNIIVLGYQYQAEKQLSVELRAAQFELAREVLPTGKIRSPERQLRALLNQSSTAGESRFSSILARVGPHLRGDAGYAVSSITFDGRTNVLRLEVRARNFQQIEGFRKALEANALRAKLLNSNARGDGILARLELSEGDAR